MHLRIGGFQQLLQNLGVLKVFKDYLVICFWWLAGIYSVSILSSKAFNPLGILKGKDKERFTLIFL